MRPNAFCNHANILVFSSFRPSLIARIRLLDPQMPCVIFCESSERRQPCTLWLPRDSLLPMVKSNAHPTDLPLIAWSITPGQLRSDYGSWFMVILCHSIRSTALPCGSLPMAIQAHRNDYLPHWPFQCPLAIWQPSGTWVSGQCSVRIKYCPESLIHWWDFAMSSARTHLDACLTSTINLLPCNRTLLT